MRQYTIDELRYADFEKLSAYLDKNLEPSSLKGIYKLTVDEVVLSPAQKAHEECRPHYVILELDETSITCEFLVRTARSMKCDCAAMASENQRNWLIGKMDAMFESMGLVY